MPFVDLDKGRVSEEILSRVPEEMASEQGILPLMEKGGKLVVAVDDPFKRIVADQLSFMLGGEVACALATPSSHRRALERYYGASEEEAVAARMGAEGLDEEGDDAPIVRLVTRMFSDALDVRASDIHVEPDQGRVRIRYRVDGMLRDVAEHPEHLGAPLMSRLKIMAKMDIAEKRKPQDGRIGLRLAGREIDVRASILPANHGETMVMRLLDRSKSLLGLRDLGFGAEDHGWFQRTIARPNGICLVTGPTGSGKTTTLYAALQELNRADVKIITAEDPVEYHIAGINQVQVNTRIGLSFSRILKAMLRCAPNVILVGEIRDLATAEIAIQAALTGHLVFSTLHTNDAPSALTRLSDLGVKPFPAPAAVHDIHLREKHGDAPVHRNHRLTRRGLDGHLEGGHRLVVGESEELGQEAEVVLTTMQDGFLRFRIENVVIVGGLEHADVFFDEEQVALQQRMHVVGPPHRSTTVVVGPL